MNPEEPIPADIMDALVQFQLALLVAPPAHVPGGELEALRAQNDGLRLVVARLARRVAAFESLALDGE